MARSNSVTTVGRWVGYGGSLAGLSGAGWLLASWVLPYYDVSLRGVILIDDAGNLGAENAPIVAFWAGVLVVLSLVTAYAVRRRTLWVLWMLAVGLPAFAVLSLFSIGVFVAPFALLTVLSAVLLTVGRRVEAPDRTTAP